jgi:hypothetical protein
LEELVHPTYIGKRGRIQRKIGDYLVCRFANGKGVFISAVGEDYKYLPGKQLIKEKSVRMILCSWLLFLREGEGGDKPAPRSSRLRASS